MWDIAVGEKLKRTEVQTRFGGQKQGGIATPKDAPNILIFSDPSEGAKYGYSVHEGLREDGSFAYTGQGQLGNQKMHMGNLALAQSTDLGKTIRLFLTEKTYATYVGAFSLGDPPYVEREARDSEGQLRMVFVFNLVPISADISVLPNYGGVTSSTSSSSFADWEAPDWSSYQVLQSAKSEEVVTASRLEFRLQHEFGNWLISNGHSVKRHTIKIGSSTISPDLFDETTNTLIEAKKSSSRGHVRTAIGQVLDYQNNERILGNSRKCALLLPSPPAADLIALCLHLGIKIYVPANSEDFSAGFKLL
jgi:hypothetical protein